MRAYTVPVQNVAISAAQDVYEVAPADDKPCIFDGVDLGQSTDYGDAAAEGVRLAIRRGDTVSGSGGSSPSIRVPDPQDASAGFTVEANNTTKANTSGVAMWGSAWNVQQAGQIWFPDTFPIKVSQVESRACLELVAAPADSLTCDHTLFVREGF